MKKLLLLLGILTVVVLITDCKKELDPIDPGTPSDTVPKMKDLIIPENFCFETSKDIQLTINGFKSAKTDGDI